MLGFCLSLNYSRFGLFLFAKGVMALGNPMYFLVQAESRRALNLPASLLFNKVILKKIIATKCLIVVIW